MDGGGKHADSIVRSFYLWQAFSLRSAHRGNDDLQFDLRCGGRSFCIQLCGQDALCRYQSHHARFADAGRAQPDAGHRRQRAGIQIPWRAEEGKSQQNVFAACLHGHCGGCGVCAGGHHFHQTHCCAAGCGGRTHPPVRGICHHSAGRDAVYDFAEYVPDFFDHGGTPRFGFEGHGRCRRYQCGAGCAVHCRVQVGHRRRVGRHSHQPDGVRLGAAGVFCAPEQQRPAAGQNGI